jgi:hypothetical protein
MHFRLRTIFIIITAAAAYTAFHVALYRWASPLISGRAFQTVFRLPVFLIWIVAAAWIMERRRTLAGGGLMLTALLLNIVWSMIAEATLAYGYHLVSSSQGSRGAWLFGVNSIIHFLVHAATWALILVAFMRANFAVRQPLPGPTPGPTDSSPWDEPKPSRTGSEAPAPASIPPS